MAYIFSRNWLTKVTKGTVQNASIYASANDLFTITNYTGTDVAGNTLPAVPVVRVTTAGRCPLRAATR